MNKISTIISNTSVTPVLDNKDMYATNDTYNASTSSASNTYGQYSYASALMKSDTGMFCLTNIVDAHLRSLSLIFENILLYGHCGYISALVKYEPELV